MESLRCKRCIIDVLDLNAKFVPGPLVNIVCTLSMSNQGTKSFGMYFIKVQAIINQSNILTIENVLYFVAFDTFLFQCCFLVQSFYTRSIDCFVFYQSICSRVYHAWVIQWLIYHISICPLRCRRRLLPTSGKNFLSARW